MYIKHGNTRQMTGQPTVLVDSASATHGRPWELEDRYVQAINRNHSDLVKFAKQDEDYEVVLHYLQKFCSVAVDIVRERFTVNIPNSKPCSHLEWMVRVTNLRSRTGRITRGGGLDLSTFVLNK